MSIAEFVYNNAKNASTNHILFKFHCGYHLKVLFKEDIDPHSRFYSADKLAKELGKMIEIHYQNLLHTQELQKRTYNKRVKSRSYALGKKI